MDCRACLYALMKSERLVSASSQTMEKNLLLLTESEPRISARPAVTLVIIQTPLCRVILPSMDSRQWVVLCLIGTGHSYCSCLP